MKKIRNTSSGMVLIIMIFLVIFGRQESFSQGVGISEAAISPDASSILELRSTLRGMLAPRMTTVQRDAILSPATGLLIYNTSTNSFNYYNGSGWIAILNGNTGVTSINGTLNRISIGGTPTVPTIDIALTYIGQSSINTLGTITTGTWNGTTVGIAYGGTGQTTAPNAFNALSPMTTLGDVIYGGAGGAGTRLAGNTSTTPMFLKQTGTGAASAAPVWGALSRNDVGLGNVENTALSTWAGSANITTLGTIASGTWNGGIITGQYGGTGVNNGTRTITLGGNLTTSGAFATTLTVTGATNVTLPTTGTLVNTSVTTLSSLVSIGTITTGTWNATTIGIAYGGTGQTTAPNAFNALSPMTTLGDVIYGGAGGAGTRLAGNTSTTPMFLKQTGTGAASAAPVWGALSRNDVGLGNVENTALSTWAGSSNITTLGTITTGTWNGGIVTGQYGGTGINNGPRTITLGGNLTTSGAFATTLTVTGATNVTLPTTGTLVNTSVTTLSSLASIGTITTGTWNGTTVGIAYGGTGQTTAPTAFNALSPMTTLGDIIYGGASGAGTRLAGNTSTTPMFLKQTGTGAASSAPVWGALSRNDVGLGNVENTALSTWTGSANITTLGTITTGTWNGGIVTGQYGGTGVNNGPRTITLGGNLTTTGAFATTLTVTGATNVTLPTTGTLVNTSVTTLSSLASIGTITSGTWNGTPIGLAYGGTGQTTAQTAINALAGGVTSGQYLRGNGTNVVMSGIVAGDVPILNQNTTGTASNVTGTVAVLHGGTGLTTFGGANTVLYTSAADVLTSVPASVAAGQFLQTTAAGGPPTWKTVLAIANGGTGSATQNFVDLTSAQTAAGAKTWSNLATFNAGLTSTGASINLNASSNFNTNINTGTSTGSVTIGNTGNFISVPATISGANPLIFDGATANANKTTFAITDPTAARTITFPDASGTVALTSLGASWLVEGNSGTVAGTNFIGTTDDQNLVFKANNVERLTVESATGDVRLGDANSGTVKSNKELVMREDGDVYGTSILRIRNRTGENGAIFETQPTNPAISLVDFIFKTSLDASNTIQRNLRFEARPGNARTGSPSFHMGGTLPDRPVLSLGDNYAAFSRPLYIGIINTPTGTQYPTPTALLQLAPGSTAANTAPLKFTPGTNLTSAEDGAVEYDGSNYFVTTGATRYTLAKTLTATQFLNFTGAGAGTSQDLTITVNGASDGDVVILGVPNNASNNANSSFSAWVSSANTVTVRFNNYSGGFLNPGGGTFRVSVLKY
jgi:hypothetical protein